MTPRTGTPADLGPLHQAPKNHQPPFDRYPDDQRGHGETIEQWIVRRRRQRQTAILDALAGIELGVHDQIMIRHFAALDDADLGTLVSWLWRARAAGQKD